MTDDHMIDNAAAASQHLPLLDDLVVRDAIQLNIIAPLRAEIERLRRLDAEYGRVETAIIMADPEFDGDSDHANCGDRLIASIERLRDEIERLRAVRKAMIRQALADMGQWAGAYDKQLQAEAEVEKLRALAVRLKSLARDGSTRMDAELLEIAEALADTGEDG